MKVIRGAEASGRYLLAWPAPKWVSVPSHRERERPGPHSASYQYGLFSEAHWCPASCQVSDAEALRRSSPCSWTAGDAQRGQVTPKLHGRSVRIVRGLCED